MGKYQSIDVGVFIPKVFLCFRYRSIHLYALGAAIPHAVMLSTSLPHMLPFPADEIKVAVETGTVKCVDEVIPAEEDEEEDEGGLQVRFKSSINVVITIGDGKQVGAADKPVLPISKQGQSSEKQPVL